MVDFIGLKGKLKPKPKKDESSAKTTEYPSPLTISSSCGATVNSNLNNSNIKKRKKPESYLTFPTSKYGKLTCVLGKGITATVSLYKNEKLGQVYAVKQYFPKEDNRETIPEYINRIQQEANLHESIPIHENIVQFFDFFVINRKKPVYVMEYVDIPLDKLLGSSANIPLAQKLCYFKQLVNGVSHLQLNKINHRDLKLENCCVTRDGNLKIIDFGSSSSTILKNGDVYSYGIIGSKILAAPEIFRSLKYDSSISDIWSLGCILLKLVFGKYAAWKVANSEEDEVFAKYKSKLSTERELNDICDLGLWMSENEYSKTFENSVEETFGRLLFKMLEIDVSKRITIEGILNDEWVNSLDFCSFGKDGVVYESHRHREFCI